MKVLYVATTGYVVYMVRFKEPFKSKYDHSQDSFLHLKFGVLPCTCLAIATQLVS
jgi:ER lumen protein retaining receptor